jgi:hypothetical protein
MKLIIDFLIRSSADPRQTSLMVKGLLLGAVTFLSAEGVQWLGLVCDFGGYCYTVNPTLFDDLRHVVNVIAEAIYYILSAVAVVWTLYGAVRKAYRTAIGENKVLD